MTEIKPQFLDNLSYAAKFDRQFPRDIFTEGIVATGDLEVTELDTPAMGVKVASGIGYVQGDQTTTQGHYRIYNDASKNLTIAASDPTNPRKDRIIAQVYDSIDIGGVDDKWVLEVLTGTPAASPTPPALPDDALDLAIVLVGANVTTIVNANITDQRVKYDLQNLATHKIADPIDHPDESITFAKTKGIERFIDLTATYTQIIDKTSMNGWEVVDVSAYVSAKSTRILVTSMHSADTSDEVFQFREKNNNREVFKDRARVVNIQTGVQVIIPLDANKQFDILSWGVVNWDVWLLGYWEEN